MQLINTAGIVDVIGPLEPVAKGWFEKIVLDQISAPADALTVLLYLPFPPSAKDERTGQKEQLRRVLCRGLRTWRAQRR